jgi:hypothetical protein
MRNSSQTTSLKGMCPSFSVFYSTMVMGRSPRRTPARPIPGMFKTEITFIGRRPMVSQPTRVQVLVLALFWIYFRIFGDSRLMGGDVSVNYEAPAVASSISR